MSDILLCGAEVVIAPPSIYLIPTAELVRNGVKVAAQNCYVKLSGAFTGEIRHVPSPLTSLSSTQPHHPALLNSQTRKSHT